MSKVYGIKTCMIDGCFNPVWSKGLCKNHVPRKKLQTSPFRNKGALVTDVTAFTGSYDVKPLGNLDRNLEIRRMFMNIWKSKPHFSELSGASLGREPFSTFFHHILPKSKHPEAALDPENIILLTPEEHDNVEIDMYRYPEVNSRREQLKIKYNIN